MANFQYFGVTADGNFRIARCTEGLQNGDYHAVPVTFNKQGSNSITITRKGDIIELQINGKIVASQPATAVADDEFGILVGGKMQIMVDEMKVTARPKT